MIFYIIAALIVLYSFIHFKKSLILCLAFKMFLNTNVTLISIPGVPILTLDLTLSLYFLVLFFLKGKRYQNAKCKFPFAIPFALLVFSWTISSLFGIAGFNSEISVLLKYIVNKVLFIWMLWQVYETKEDFYRIFKLLTIVYLISCIYGMFEISTLSNPLTQYSQTLNKDPEKVINWDYSDSGRGYRINAIFEHAIGAGLNYAMFVVFGVFLLLQKKLKPNNQIIITLTVVLSIVCLVLTRSRTPLIFLAIGLIGQCNFNKKRTWVYVLSGLLFVFFVLPIISPDTVILFKSAFDTSLTNEVGGSSLSLRMDQLLVSFQLVSSSFICGLGTKYNTVISGDLISRLMGSESIWFQVIPSFGLIGLIAYITEFVFFVYIIPKRFKSKNLFIWGIAYWIAITVSSTPGFLEYIYFLIMFYHIKNSDIYKSLDNNIYGVYFKKFKLYHGNIGKR